jgi:superfamily II DNA or RNA helicase
VEDDEEERTRIVDRFSMILRANNWISSNFTYNESNADRRRIMEEFKEGEIQALLAIKVLDEGFDLPVCQEAYITASSTNERQYIQRRGRILRKSEGKELAKIHDFVILPDFYDAAYSSLVKNEIDRVEDFFKDALNSKDFYKNQTIKKILKMYKLES